jgi:tripartite ATP-independent transporter DctM subunit
MVVYGILTDSSIGKLLIAGIVPGLVFAALICLVTWLTVWRRPERAPVQTQRYTLREKLWALRLTGPLLLIILGVISGLYLGVFTPTEAGAVGALLTLVLAWIRQRSWRRIEVGKALLETVRASSMIFGIIICALLFSKFLALSGVTAAVGDWMTGLEVNRWVIILIIVAIYLVFGMMMDAPALLAISLPITHPVALALGFDPIWFGIFVVVLVEIGAVTPPVGINCFVVQAASNNRVRLEDVFGGLVPFVGAGLMMLILMCLFPQMALYLPGKM